MSPILAPTEVKQRVDQTLASLRAKYEDPNSGISEPVRQKIKAILFDQNALGRPTAPIQAEHVLPFASSLYKYTTGPSTGLKDIALKPLATLATGPAAALDVMALPARVIGRPLAETAMRRDPQLNFIEKAARSLQQDRDIGNVGARREAADAYATQRKLMEQGMSPQEAAAKAQNRVTGAWLLGGTLENALTLADPYYAWTKIAGRAAPKVTTTLGDSLEKVRAPEAAPQLEQAPLDAFFPDKDLMAPEMVGAEGALPLSGPVPAPAAPKPPAVPWGVAENQLNPQLKQFNMPEVLHAPMGRAPEAAPLGGDDAFLQWMQRPDAPRPVPNEQMSLDFSQQAPWAQEGPVPTKALPNTADEYAASKTLVVANEGADGKIYYGEPGELHFNLSEKYGDAIRNNLGLAPGDPTWKRTGFAFPGGPLLTREEALKVSGVKGWGSKELDAKVYQAQLKNRDFQLRAEWQKAQTPTSPSLQDLIAEYSSKGIKPSAAERMAKRELGMEDILSPAPEPAQPTPSVRPLYDQWQDDSQELFDSISANLPPKEQKVAVQYIFDADNAINKGDLQGAVASIDQLRGKVDDESFSILDSMLGKYKNAKEPVVVPSEEAAALAEDAAKKAALADMKASGLDVEKIVEPPDPKAIDDLVTIVRGLNRTGSTNAKMLTPEAQAALERWKTTHGPAVVARAKAAGKDVATYIQENYPGVPIEDARLMAKALVDVPTPATQKTQSQGVPIETKAGRGQYQGKVNLSKYAEPDVAGKVMDLVDSNPSLAAKFKISDADVNDIAQAIAEGNKTERVMKAILSGEKGQLAGELRYSGQKAATAIDTFLKTDFGADTTKLKTEIDNILATYVDAPQRVASELGRGLRTFGLPVEAQSAIKAQIDDLIAKYGKDKNKAALLTKLKASVLDSDFNPSAWDKAYYIWINGLVGGPKTLAVNILGNTTHLISKLPDRVLESLVDMGISLKTGKRTTTMDEIPNMIKGAFSKEPVPSSFAYKGSKTTEDVAPQSPLQDKFTSKYVEPLMYGTKALRGTDKWFGNLVTKMEYSALKGKGLSDLDMKQLITDEAKFRTFTRDPAALTNALLYIKTKLAGVRWVMPFVRTSADIIGQGIEHTPAGLVNLARKTTSQRDAAQRIARMIKGSLLGVWAYDQLKKGKITGDAPKDARGRSHFLDVQKKQENSVLVNGRWVPLSNFEPVGSTISAFVNFFEGASRAKKDDKGAAQQFMNGSIAAGAALLNKRYLSSVNTLFRLLENPEQRVPELVGQIGGGFVSGGVKAITDQMDTTQRRTGNIGEQIQKRVPGASKKLAPSLDVYGRPRTKPSTLNLLNTKDAALSREDRLIYETPMSMPSDKINGVKLTPTEYEELSRLAGQYKTTLVNKSSKLLEKLRDDRKQYFVDRINDNANQAAKMQMMKKYPKFRPTFPFLD